MMKRALAVVFLLMSLASIALADGGGLPPPPSSSTSQQSPVHP